MTVLERLQATIEARANADPDTSWTARLLAAGPEECAGKFGEEAVEAIVEAVRGDRKKLTAEAADVIYHLLVMLTARGVTLKDVLAELERREGTSGIDEKATRERAVAARNSDLWKPGAQCPASAHHCTSLWVSGTKV